MILVKGSTNDNHIILVKGSTNDSSGDQEIYKGDKAEILNQATSSNSWPTYTYSPFQTLSPRWNT